MYKRIRELREDHDKRQSDLANDLNTYVTQYRRWETGETEIPTHILRQLAIYYNVSADYILELPQNLPYPKR